MFQLTPHPIDLNALSLSLKESKAGALVTFEGWVRNHNQGKPVSALEYQVYETLAEKEGQKILTEAKEKFNLHEIVCTHRHGLLQIGEVAVWVGASASHRNDAFLATRFVIDEIKHRLPIWKKEHYLNEKPEWVSCKDHSTHVHFKEEDYYRKQKSVVDPFSLKSKRVAVIGAGGLGCPVLASLAAAGIGHLTVVDFDRVEISNLHRQFLYTPADIGEKKSTVAAKRIAQMNPFIQIKAVDQRFNAMNGLDLIEKCDLVLDCTDNLETKFAIHDLCMSKSIPLISASIYRFEGQIRTFDRMQEWGCLRCQFKETPSDEAIGNCNDFGVLGASVNAMGSLQAGEAIRFLIHARNASSKETIYFDLNSLSAMKIKNKRKSTCTTCSLEAHLQKNEATDHTETERIELESSELSGNDELVDIREQNDTFLDDFIHSKKRVVVFCHRGIRSRRLVHQYRERGFHHFYSLTGGACSL